MTKVEELRKDANKIAHLTRQIEKQQQKLAAMESERALLEAKYK